MGGEDGVGEMECWSDGSSVTRQPPATSMTKLRAYQLGC